MKVVTPNRPSATAFLPTRQDLSSLREAAGHCRGCDLYQHATQAVFGEGRSDARMVLIGEQPGDREDQLGRPFVGPAGKLLDKCLEAAGIDRSTVYVTNAVKHFKWEPRGKIRLHKKPNSLEILACRPWLDKEIAAISPQLIVCLGATVAQSLLGANFRLTEHRGEVFSMGDGPAVTATIHPSAVLRKEAEEKEKEEVRLINDLRIAARYVSENH